MEQHTKAILQLLAYVERLEAENRLYYSQATGEPQEHAPHDDDGDKAVDFARRVLVI